MAILRKRIGKQNNIRQAAEKCFLEKSFLIWQCRCHSFAKSHRTRYIIFSEFNWSFNKRNVWNKRPYLNKNKRSDKAANMKNFEEKHSLGNFTTKKLLSIFRLPLNFWRKCLSESRKQICKQVIVSGTQRRTKQLSEKVSRSQNHLENYIFFSQNQPKFWLKVWVCRIAKIENI